MAKKKTTQINIDKNKKVILAVLSGMIIGIVGAWALGISSAAPLNKGGGGSTGGGKNGETGSFSLVMVTDKNGDGQPNWGDTVTFNVTSTAPYPSVALKCYQGKTLVYGATAGFYDSYTWPFARDMGLASSVWTGGAANCTAVLTGSSAKSPLATINFTANP